VTVASLGGRRVASRSCATTTVRRDARFVFVQATRSCH
jgi:hypothetical protein